MIVADSNLIAYLLIPGNKSALADEVFLKDCDWAVPLICRSEIRNILTLYMRQQGMSLSLARDTMDRADLIWGDREFSVPSDDVLELTFHNKVSAYDAEFVVLACQLGVSLITFDKALRKTFPSSASFAEEFLKTDGYMPDK